MRSRSRDSCVVGVDIHQDFHVGVLLDETASELMTMRFENSKSGFQEFVAEVEKYSNFQICYALEDVGSNGKRLAEYLVSQGNEVIFIPPNYTENRRKHTPQADKNDYEDAKRVAQEATLQRRSGKLPFFMLSQSTKSAEKLRSLCHHRRKLTERGAELKNQLRKQFRDFYGMDYENQVSCKDIFNKTSLKQWFEKLDELDLLTSISIRQKLEMLQSVNTYKNEIDEVIEKESQDVEEVRLLTTIPGISVNVAAEIFGEIKDIRKFRSQSALAKYSGIAPRSHSSGKYTRYYTNHRGNRRLNQLFYMLALNHISKHGPGNSKDYYGKKVGEGKSKKHGLRCLQRQLVKIVYVVLNEKREFEVRD